MEGVGNSQNFIRVWGANQLNWWKNPYSVIDPPTIRKGRVDEEKLYGILILFKSGLLHRLPTARFTARDTDMGVKPCYITEFSQQMWLLAQSRLTDFPKCDICHDTAFLPCNQQRSICAVRAQSRLTSTKSRNI